MMVIAPLLDIVSMGNVVSKLCEFKLNIKVSTIYFTVLHSLHFIKFCNILVEGTKNEGETCGKWCGKDYGWCTKYLYCRIPDLTCDPGKCEPIGNYTLQSTYFNFTSFLIFSELYF